MSKLWYINQQRILGGEAEVPWYLAAGTPIAAYLARGAASLVASYVNLVTPGTYDLTVDGGTTPIWDNINGWKCNATFLKTGIVPNGSYSMMIIATAVGSGADSSLGGEDTVGAGFSLFNHLTGASQRGYRYIGTIRTVTGAAVGTYTLCLAGNQGYYNGIVDGAAIAGVWGTATNDIYIGEENAAFGCVENIKAVVISDKTWSSAEVLALHTRMLNL